MCVTSALTWRSERSYRIYTRLTTDSFIVDDMTRRLDELEASLISLGGDSASATPAK
jgi:hypothetical protein